jgi:hypothetical protein
MIGSMMIIIAAVEEEASKSSESSERWAILINESKTLPEAVVISAHPKSLIMKPFALECIF